MDMRELKALELAARSKIVFSEGAWLVPSQTSPTTTYRVTIGDPPSCQCDDFNLRQKPCKHVIAARLVCARDHGGETPKIVTDAVPKRPTYKQDWPKYNLAQTTEKHRFQALLFDLCRLVPQPEREAKTGRKPLPIADALFAAAFKVYSTFSSRRFMCDLNDAHERGYLSRPVHYNCINSYLENPELTPILHGLIRRSAGPLAAVEVDFAVDSSGFSTSRFVRWFDEKYGVERSGHDWVKAHICTGVKTNIVTATEILDRDAGDSPQFRPLAKTTAEVFKIREISGDKAYSGTENTELVFELGGTPFIACKSNATGGAGGLFEKMFHFYKYRREEFLQHYHKRSLSESTFSMVKAKFRDHVRSRTDVAMVNEVLCKFLCHNLCCVIMSQIELGIVAEFWPEEAPADDGPCHLLRFPG
jgi:transposase